MKACPAMIAGVHHGEQGLEPGRVAREQPGCGRALAFPYADRRSRRSDDWVWGAAGASASINFSYEYGQSSNLIAGGYVSLLSVLGMVMFHEFLSQFEDGTDNRIRRENPKFGLRWLTWPSNTLLAAIAWRNHPPAEGTPGTVAAAVANLNRVRETKRLARTTSPVKPGPPATAAPVAAALVAHPRPVPASAGNYRPAARRPARAQRRPVSDGDTDVPITAATVLAWAQTWVHMSADEELMSGPFSPTGKSAGSAPTSQRTVWPAF